ncbi:MAG: protein kinase domain-containing protein, partial [Pyrinomonadaceae bacterium]
MTPERWQQIDSLLQEVLERPVAERASLLSETCSGDESLRQEVESLINYRESAEAFLEVPAFEAAAEFFFDSPTDSIVGQFIPPYKIEAKLGAGGMGEVYLAEDTQLDRKVAIKFLPLYLEADELAKRRLIREAKAAAKLDHPNICAVYEVREEAGRSFIVMQHVAGITLADKVKDQKLDVRQALDLSIQIVEALAEAHSHGIVHRDIKPANIMVTPRGQLKVLDFGLAKVLGAVGPTQDESTGQIIVSRAGERPGTPPYMSPEQVVGIGVDERSDLFAVGVILYECLTGRRPFAGKTDTEVLEQVRHYHPPGPSQVNPQIPPELDQLIFKTLAKKPDARYQSAGDLLKDLYSVRAALLKQDDVETKPISFKEETSKFPALITLANAFRQSQVYIPTILATLAVAPLLLWYFLPKSPHQVPPQAQYWYEAGTNALSNGAYYEASKELRQAVEIDDKFALAHARLADAYSELDYSDKAKDEIIRAQSLAGESKLEPATALQLQAITKTVLRDFAPAIESYQQIALRAPEKEKVQVYLDLGRAYEKNDELEKAKKNYQQAANLAPQDAAAILRLGVLFGRQQDSKSASDAFKKAEELYRDHSDLEGVAEVLYQRGFLFLNEVEL